MRSNFHLEWDPVLLLPALTLPPCIPSPPSPHNEATYIHSHSYHSCLVIKSQKEFPFLLQRRSHMWVDSQCSQKNKTQFCHINFTFNFEDTRCRSINKMDPKLFKWGMPGLFRACRMLSYLSWQTEAAPPNNDMQYVDNKFVSSNMCKNQPSLTGQFCELGDKKPTGLRGQGIKP